MINYKLATLSEKHLKSLYYNLPYKSEEALQLILLSYANLECLTDLEKNKYNQLVKKLTFDCPVNKKTTVSIDNTNRNEWEENHPECVNRKTWEKIALRICNKYFVEIEKIPLDTVCDISFEIVKETLSCDLLLAISLQQKLCDLNISVNRTKEECATDYKLLIEKQPTCSLSKKEYMCLIDKNFSFEIINLIYNNSSTLEVDSKGNVTLISPIRKYKIPQELRLNDVIYDSKNKTLAHVILDEYNISKKTKENIINELRTIQN